MPLPATIVAAVDIVRRKVDHVAPPEFRQNMWTGIKAFYSEKPLRFTFFLAQLTFASMPFFTFLALALSFFSIFVTGLLFTGLSAALVTFSIMIPVIIVSFFLGTFTWVMSVALIGLSRLAYEVFKSAFSVGGHGLQDEPRAGDETGHVTINEPPPAPAHTPDVWVPSEARRTGHEQAENPRGSEKEPVLQLEFGPGLLRGASDRPESDRSAQGSKPGKQVTRMGQRS